VQQQFSGPPFATRLLHTDVPTVPDACAAVAVNDGRARNALAVLLFRT
jgi:hypothetical protein